MQTEFVFYTFSGQSDSVQFSCSVVSDSLWPHGLPPCPSPTPRVYPNPCPLNRWCHPNISSSVMPISCHIVQETGMKTIPMEKQCKKAKWLSGEALQIAVKRREAKSKGEKERYKHLNAEFQRIARRDKKAFLSGHCKEIEENKRMGKTRDLFKTIRDTKGTFHA